MHLRDPSWIPLVRSGRNARTSFMLRIATLTFSSVLTADACALRLTSVLSKALSLASRATICAAATRKLGAAAACTTPHGSVECGRDHQDIHHRVGMRPRPVCGETGEALGRTRATSIAPYQTDLSLSVGATLAVSVGQRCDPSGMSLQDSFQTLVHQGVAPVRWPLSTTRERADTKPCAQQGGGGLERGAQLAVRVPT
jgi:hypothetical protein